MQLEVVEQGFEPQRPGSARGATRDRPRLQPLSSALGRPAQPQQSRALESAYKAPWLLEMAPEMAASLRTKRDIERSRRAESRSALRWGGVCPRRAARLPGRSGSISSPNFSWLCDPDLSLPRTLVCKMGMINEDRFRNIVDRQITQGRTA